jgi:hypothetical protein
MRGKNISAANLLDNHSQDMSPKRANTMARQRARSLAPALDVVAGGKPRCVLRGVVYHGIVQSALYLGA